MKQTYKGKSIKVHGIFQYSNPIPAEIHIGGAPAGVIAYPVAVIEFEDGTFAEVSPRLIKGSDEE